MGNVSFISIVTSSGGAGNFIASVVSRNFQNLVSAMNSGSLNSDNYGTGTNGFQSQHIAVGNVVSNHFSDSQFIAGKVATSQILHSHIFYRTSDSGIMALQMPKNGPAGGMRFAQVTHPATFTTGPAVVTDQWTVVYSSQGLYGNPGFVSTPYLLGKPILATATLSTPAVIDVFMIRTMNSDSMVAYVKYNTLAAVSSVMTLTASMAFAGA